MDPKSPSSRFAPSFCSSLDRDFWLPAPRVCREAVCSLLAVPAELGAALLTALNPAGAAAAPASLCHLPATPHLSRGGPSGSLGGESFASVSRSVQPLLASPGGADRVGRGPGRGRGRAWVLAVLSPNASGSGGFSPTASLPWGFTAGSLELWMGLSRRWSFLHWRQRAAGSSVFGADSGAPRPGWVWRGELFSGLESSGLMPLA